jgi:hypothetical protein
MKDIASPILDCYGQAIDHQGGLYVMRGTTMNHSELYLAVIRQRAREIDERAQRVGPMLKALKGRADAPSSDPLTVRFAGAADEPALRRLAELDCAAVPSVPLLLGERDGRAVAALSLNDGTVVANPFVATADVVALLELRARQLGRRGRRRLGRRRAIAWRLLRAGG